MKVLITGIGGYGANYTNALLDVKPDEDIEIAGVVDPSPENYNRIDEIIKKGIPIYSDQSDFFKKHEADLTVISSPIQFHKPQIIYALNNNSNVLCEKPMCATVKEGIEIIEHKNKTGKIVSIGFQWAFSGAILALKKDILNNRFGRAKSLRTIVLWPRNYKYYNRNRWAGKEKDLYGNYILDSVANNAAAHYLHNMFFVLGSEMDIAERPKSVEAELYRANDIETFDTCAIRSITKSGVELLFLASHAVKESKGPEFIYEFEDADIVYNGSTNGEITARFKNGQEKRYMDPNSSDLNKLWDTIKAVKENKRAGCTPEAAFSQTLCINAANKSCPDIGIFPKELVKEYIIGNDRGSYIEDLYRIMMDAYDSKKLLNEIGIDWSKKNEIIDVDTMELL